MNPIDRIDDLFTFPNFEPQAYCHIDDRDQTVRILLNAAERPQKVSAECADAFAAMSTAPGLEMSAISLRAVSTSPWLCHSGVCVAPGAV